MSRRGIKRSKNWTFVENLSMDPKWLTMIPPIVRKDFSKTACSAEFSFSNRKALKWHKNTTSFISSDYQSKWSRWSSLSVSESITNFIFLLLWVSITSFKLVVVIRPPCSTRGPIIWPMPVRLFVRLCDLFSQKLDHRIILIFGIKFGVIQVKKGRKLIFWKKKVWSQTRPKMAKIHKNGTTI